MKAGVFIDRDGTLIELVHHLTDPCDVTLSGGTAKAVRLLRGYGYACILVTNQSVVGRGMLSLEGLNDVHAEIKRRLAEYGTELDGIYYNTVVPRQSDTRIIEHSDRKPGPGMLLRAAQELELDLSRSWMVGDSISDMLAGRNAGCRSTILVRTGYGEETDSEDDAIDYVVKNFSEAAKLILVEDKAIGDNI